ncbi:MAG: hypothetical protein HRU33_13730 [Rhodobacteraceae bacterium]|nr:hypothetical protein [Paracoccaceae bacterium]
MTVPTFKQAVEIPKHMIAPHLVDIGNVDRTTLDGLAAARAAQCDTTDADGYTEYRAEIYGASKLMTSPEQLIELAKTDYFQFQALSRAVANVLELGCPVPKCLQS